jgi:hypothetical protein
MARDEAAPAGVGTGRISRGLEFQEVLGTAESRIATISNWLYYLN